MLPTCHPVPSRNHFVSQFWPKFCLLFTPARLPLNQISFGLPQCHAKNASLFQLQLYFYKGFLKMKDATASLRNCGRII